MAWALRRSRRCSMTAVRTALRLDLRRMRAGDAAMPPEGVEERRILLALTTQRDSYAALSRGLSYLFLLGSLFALAAMVVPPSIDGRVFLLVGAGLAAAALLWVRAAQMKRWGCRLLTIVGSATTATAIYLSESTDAPGALSVGVSRLHWFLTVGTFLLGGVLIHRLVLRVREYVQILDSIARTDTLTGMPNRRAWDEALPDEIARCRREGRPLCVGMIAIDHFKAFNDSRGPQEGDILLRRAAAAEQGSLLGDA